jgi:hypothetical protein
MNSHFSPFTVMRLGLFVMAELSSATYQKFFQIIRLTNFASEALITS